MDSTTLGITVLDGSTRVRSNGQLIRLEDLASTPGQTGPPGPQGPQGVQGEAGQDGEDGTVDTSNFYSKAQVVFVDGEHPIDWNMSGSRCQRVG